MSGQTGFPPTSQLLTPAPRNPAIGWARAGEFRGRWGFSLFLGLAYIAVFHVWLLLDDDASAIVGGAVATSLWVALRQRERAGYFLNVWDKRFHAVVIMDLLVESFIPFHEGYGFYWCAASFAVLVGGYRKLDLARSSF